MRILWLTTRPPYPPDSGGKIYALNRIKELHRRGHTVDLVAAAERPSDPADPAIVEPLRQWCDQVHIFAGAPFRPPRPVALATLPWGAYRRLPDAATLGRIVATARACDVVQVEQSAMIPLAELVLARAPRPAVLALYSDGAAALRASARAAGLPWPRRAAVLAEAVRLGRLERRALSGDRFTHVTFVSPEAVTRAARVMPDGRRRARLVTVPVEVGDEADGRAGPADAGGPTPPTALFVASFADPGNQLAYEWLARQVLPVLPDDLRVVVAGRRASALAPPPGGAVQLVADPADLTPLYRAAAVVLVPVVSGGGVRVKLLDAAARSAPVVSTTLGLEGTTLVPGEDLLVGDTPEAFAAAVAAALADPEAARGRAANAVRKLTSLHSPASVGDEMESIYRAAVHGPAGGG